MTAIKTAGEFDTDEVKAINKYIADAPRYFEKTDKIFGKVFGNGVPGMDEDLRTLSKDMREVLELLKASKPLETRQKVDDLFGLAKTVTLSVALFLITSGIGGVIYLMRTIP
jgi:hypothetical protein